MERKPEPRYTRLENFYLLFYFLGVEFVQITRYLMNSFLKNSRHQ